MINRSFFKALIVDDEQYGRDQLEYHLNRHKDVQIIASVNSVDTAMSIIRDDIPDIIFLDIDMPDKNGFELIKEMRETDLKPSVVFVTAYEQYARQAIRQAALDYILKPISKDEFDVVLEKFRKKAAEEDFQTGITKLLNQLEKPGKLRFNQKGKTIFIDSEEILYCKANGNYTEIHQDNTHKEIVSHHLKQVQEMLTGDFQRLGRSLIIHKKYLAEIDRMNKSLTLRKQDVELTIRVAAHLLNEI